MASNVEVLNWQRFFVAAGIPGAVALKYSKSFAEQRMKFTMLKELDKSVLMDLGVTTVGDQIAILQQARKWKVSEKEITESQPRVKSDLLIVKNEKKNISTAPDRDDIYHIHLPAGTTPKTQAILQKHNMLKSAGRVSWYDYNMLVVVETLVHHFSESETKDGLLKRGSSGVRRSGKEIVRIPSHNNKWNHSNMARKTSKDVNMVDSSEVSSTTDQFYDLLGVKGLVSDQLNVQKQYVRGDRLNVPSSSTIFERAVNGSASNCGSEPIFRVRISEMGKKKTAGFHASKTTLVRPKFSGVVKKRTAQFNQTVKNYKTRVGERKNHAAETLRLSVFDRLS